MSKVLSIAHDGSLYQVLFTRLNSSRLAKGSADSNNSNTLEAVDTVRCEILDGDMQIIAEGIAVKANDTELFSFARGLRLSLARALDTLESVFGWTRDETKEIIDALYANYPKAKPDVRNVCGCMFNFDETTTHAEIARQILPYVDAADVKVDGAAAEPTPEPVTTDTGYLGYSEPAPVADEAGDSYPFSRIPESILRRLPTPILQELAAKKAASLGVTITRTPDGKLSDKTLLDTLRAAIANTTVRGGELRGAEQGYQSAPIKTSFQQATDVVNRDRRTPSVLAVPVTERIASPTEWRRINRLSDGSLWLSAYQMEGWLKAAGIETPLPGDTIMAYEAGKALPIKADVLMPCEFGDVRVGKYASMFLDALGNEGFNLVVEKIKEFAGGRVGPMRNDTILTARP